MTPPLGKDALLLLRDLAPRVLGILVRRYRDFAECEDAVQEALIAAAAQWPREGMPDNPLAWLTRVATRRLTDRIRANAARRFRERLVVSLIPADEQIAMAADETASARDETLDLYFLCCHPALTASSQVALTLRAVGGLTTAEIARAFLVPEATMAQRLSRAKATIKESGVAFPDLSPAERAARLPAVLRVLYLIFNEGYMPTSGESVYRVDLSAEAIRVARLLESVSGSPEVQGLLALMLLTDARRAARSGPSGELIPLDRQDRAKWNLRDMEEGTQLLHEALAKGAAGPYQLQAAIAALHDEAPSIDATDWPQILALYDVLLGIEPSPMAKLSRAIAVAMVDGPAAGIAELDLLATDARLAGNYRVEAARAHLYERVGDRQRAILHYRGAANGTISVAERNYLLLRAATLREEADDDAHR